MANHDRVPGVAACVMLLGLAATSVAAAPPTTSAPEERDWDPPALTVQIDHEAASRGTIPIGDVVRAGRRLFETKFNQHDGAGRPQATGNSKPTPREKPAAGFNRIAGPDANSCFGCHNDPASGGSGDFAANVFVGAHFSDPPTLRVDVNLTNERNTTSLFGSGLVEMVAREMTEELRSARMDAIAAARRLGRAQSVQLVAKGVSFGMLTARPDGTLDTSRVEGIDDDLVVKPFGVKGVAVSLREFALFALNQHHGMQGVERFGWERTGRRDFDGDGVEDEVSIGQVTALVMFQASLPPPEAMMPAEESAQAAVRRGSAAFRDAGCSTCHVPELPLRAREFSEPSPYNRPGALTPEGHGVVRLALPGSRTIPDGPRVVRAFTDFKRHRICDAETPFLCNEHVRQDNVPTDLFMTAKLWDVATSAPYCHRGDCLTLSQAILAHGGEAASSRRRFEALATQTKRDLVAYLRTLGALHPAMHLD